MTEITFAEAFVDAMIDAMEADPTVGLIGSIPLGLGPETGQTDRIRARFPDRVIDPPIAEAGIAAMATGAAMAGVRPFVDLGTGTFAYNAWMYLVNEAPLARYMSNGKLKAPVVFHSLEGVRGAGAPQHSGTTHAMLWNAPGLQLVLPSTAADAYGLVRQATRSEDPVMFFSHALLLGLTGPMPETRGPIPFGKADIKRVGGDLTIVATSIMVHRALKAAEVLASEGIEAEVVDPRTLVPFDEETILASVAKTGRLVVADEAPLRAGVASEIAATVAEKAFDALKAPPVRVTRMDVPVPFSPPLEAATIADADAIVRAARRVCGVEGKYRQAARQASEPFPAA